MASLTGHDHPRSLYSTITNETEDERSHSFDITFTSTLSHEDLELHLLPKASGSPQITNAVEDPVPEEPKARQKSGWTRILHPRFIHQFQDWASRHGFSGWRFGVLTGLLTTTFVLLANILLLLLGAVRYGGYQDGVAELARGYSHSISAISAAYHVIINILSTLLLGASNYSMQVLSSPSRSNINQAHEKGTWLDIGVLSYRNLRCISRRRFWLWLILASSSIPLHLFYNSAIFEVTTGNQFTIYFIDGFNETEVKRIEAINDHYPLDTNDPAAPMTFWNASGWKLHYEKRYVSQYSDLYLIFYEVGIPTDVYSNLTKELPVTEWEFYPYPMEVDPTILNADPAYWFWGIDGDWVTPYLDTGSYRVAFAAAKKAAPNCSVQISLLFMLIVICFNLMKGVTMLLLLLDRSGIYLVTCGDAVASFLERPDTVTEGYCVASRGELCETPPGSAGKMYKRRITTTIEEARTAGGYAWRPRRFTWGSAISTNKRMFSTGFCGGLLLGGIMLNVYMDLLFSDTNSWGWAASSSAFFNNMDLATTSVLLNAWLANAPQLILSAIYLTFNTLYTSIALAREWNLMAIKRKALRVTDPRGEQRSTYFLQLPYRWAIPLITTSGVLHWLLSQTVFLVRLDISTSDGEVIPHASVLACGFSRSAFTAFLGTGGILCVVTWIVSFRRMRENIPMASSCSAMISAACHPPADDLDAHLKKVQWGAVKDTYGGIGHCTFTSQPVTKPVPGEVYA